MSESTTALTWGGQDAVLAAQGGDPEAWRRLVLGCGPAVLGWCRYLGGPGVEPDEVAQEVFIRLYQRFDRLHSHQHFRAFLYGIARRVIAEHRRRLWWRRWVPGPIVPRPDPRPDPEARLASGQTVAWIDAVLARLPPRYREVIVLTDVEGLSQSEVAGLLGVPVNTVKSRLSRGRARFRAEAERDGLAAHLLSQREGTRV